MVKHVFGGCTCSATRTWNTAQKRPSSSPGVETPDLLAVKQHSAQSTMQIPQSRSLNAVLCESSRMSDSESTPCTGNPMTACLKWTNDADTSENNTQRACTYWHSLMVTGRKALPSSMWVFTQKTSKHTLMVTLSNTVCAAWTSCAATPCSSELLSYIYDLFSNCFKSFIIVIIQALYPETALGTIMLL